MLRGFSCVCGEPLQRRRAQLVNGQPENRGRCEVRQQPTWAVLQTLFVDVYVDCAVHLGLLLVEGMEENQQTVSAATAPPDLVGEPAKNGSAQSAIEGVTFASVSVFVPFRSPFCG